MKLKMTECHMQVNQVACECYLGVYDSEQVQMRTVWVDVEMDLLLSLQGAREDCFDKVLNYERIVEVIQRVGRARRYALVESLCVALLEHLGGVLGGKPTQAPDGLPWPDVQELVTTQGLTVRVTKPTPMPAMQSVTISMSSTFEADQVESI